MFKLGISNKDKAAYSLIIVLSLIFVLSGCGTELPDLETLETPAEKSYVEGYDRDTVNIYSDGSVLEISCEDFSDTSIDISGLYDYIETAISSATSGDAITLEEYREESGLVKTAIKYDDIAAYNSFNGYDMEITDYTGDAASVYTATLTDASVNASLSDATVSVSDIGASGLSMLVFDRDIDVILSGATIYYYNSGVNSVIGDTAVLNGETTAVIVFGY